LLTGDINTLVQQHCDRFDDPREVAEYVAKRFGARRLREFALEWITHYVKQERRGRTLLLERDAEQKRVDEHEHRRAVQKAADEERRRLARYSSHKDVPPEDRDAWARTFPHWMPKDSDTYRTWAESPEGRSERARWVEREESDRRHAEKMRQIFDDYERTLKMEWTRELLDAKFALGDGTYVTWGSATVADHVARLDMLRGNVRANLEAIKRHEAALNDLRHHEVDTLDSVNLIG
jgi:hypothetical protein